MKILYTQHVASAPDNHICLGKPILIITPNSQVYPDEINSDSVQRGKKHTTVGLLFMLCHVCTKTRPAGSVPQRRAQGQNRIRVDSCWCALCFMSVLRGEICKRDRHRKLPGIERGRRRPAAGLKLIRLKGQYLFCAATCHRWTGLETPQRDHRRDIMLPTGLSRHAGLIRDLTRVM